MDSLDDAIATDGQNTPTITVPNEPEPVLQTMVIDPDDPIGGLMTGIDGLTKIFQERNPSSWQTGYPVLQFLARSRAPACKLGALEDLREPVQSVIAMGAAIDGLWGVMWRCLPHSSHDRAHAASLQPVRRTTIHLGEIIADTPTIPGRDIVLSRLSLRSFHRGPSFTQTAVPDTRTLFLMAAMNAHLLHVMPIIDPGCLQRIKPTSELRSCGDSLHNSDLMGRVNDLRWTMLEAQACWRGYAKKIILPPTRLDTGFRFLCSQYRVLCVMIVLLHILLTLLFNSWVPVFVLVFLTMYMDGIKATMKAVFVDPVCPYIMQYDVAKAILTIREQLDGVADAFEEPLRVLTDIVDAEHHSETDPSIEDMAQKDRVLLDFMLNFDLKTGGRIQRHSQAIRSKLEDVIEERRAENRHRSPLRAVYEYFRPPERSSGGPGPDGNALPRDLV